MDTGSVRVGVCEHGAVTQCVTKSRHAYVRRYEPDMIMPDQLCHQQRKLSTFVQSDGMCMMPRDAISVIPSKEIWRKFRTSIAQFHVLSTSPIVHHVAHVESFSLALPVTGKVQKS